MGFKIKESHMGEIRNMDRKEIEKIIPHRDSMLLIDEAEITEDKKAIGKYTIKGNEWFLDGHFPGNPIVPGVVLCEMMAQTCSVLFKEIDAKIENATPMFTGLNNVKFKNPVRVGDKIIFECEINRAKPPFYFASGKGSVKGKLCVTCEFSFALVR